ncbi:MAG TPA: YciI family protein [Gaiellaceae bacterium]|nr:YciI family protein [Gaiellaceae bacterium]
MARYLISFDDGAMTFPGEELPDVSAAAHAVVREAMDAGVWVFGGGLFPPESVDVVGTDGKVAAGAFRDGKAYVGGFSVVEVPSRAEALEWAARIASACRCAQEVREFLPDPAVGN